jgi:predicted small lipoprotein YifL
MKKLFSFVVVAALATSFASCGGDKAPAAEAPAADTTAAVETPAVVETPAAETATPAAAETATPAQH